MTRRKDDVMSADTRLEELGEAGWAGLHLVPATVLIPTLARRLRTPTD